MKKTLIAIALLLVATASWADESIDSINYRLAPPDTIIEYDTIYYDGTHSSPRYRKAMTDSLGHIVDPLYRDTLGVGDSRLFVFGSDSLSLAENPVFPDSIYRQRLEALPAVVPMVYCAEVRSFIDRYAGRLRGQVSRMLGMEEYYLPIFEQALDVYDVPNELKYLPVIESAFNPVAVSRAGATGLWQFMYRTGREYGLQQNSLVDDRRDPIKSTWAAARYLHDLYSRFGDWSLAIAAYNCGPGNILKAQARSGKTGFWEIYPYLPRETRSYVPIFIAANYIMTYHEEHGIYPTECSLVCESDTVQLSKSLHFRQIAETCDVDMELLHALNPQYKTDVIPASYAPCTLRMPMDKLVTFLELGDSVYNYKKDELFNQQKVAEVKQAVANGGAAGGYTTHKVKSGETLGLIAKRNHVTVAQLKKWNHLRSDVIRVGQTLRIYR